MYICFSYLVIILTPKLFVGLTKFRTTGTRRFADFLHRMVTNFNVLLERNDASCRSTVFNVSRFVFCPSVVALVFEHVFDDNVWLSDASATLVNEATSGDVLSGDTLSSNNCRDVWRKVSNLLKVFRS